MIEDISLNFKLGIPTKVHPRGILPLFFISYNDTVFPLIEPLREAYKIKQLYLNGAITLKEATEHFKRNLDFTISHEGFRKWVKSNYSPDENILKDLPEREQIYQCLMKKNTEESS